jgi:hypothetical protein
MNDEKGWQAAETALRTYYRDKKGWSVDHLERSSLPYLFKVVFPDGMLDAVVSGGHVVEEHGMPALTTVLRQAAVLEHKQEAATLYRVLDVLQAFPQASPDGRLQMPEFGDLALQPRVEASANALKLILSYVMPAREAMPDQQVVIEEWTLSIAPGYRLSWSSRTKMVRLPGKQ